MNTMEARMMRRMMAHGIPGPRAKQLVIANPCMNNRNAASYMIDGHHRVNRILGQYAHHREQAKFLRIPLRIGWQTKAQWLDEMSKFHRERRDHIAFYARNPANTFVQNPRLP